jgi:hypothetical protein
VRDVHFTFCSSLNLMEISLSLSFSFAVNRFYSEILISAINMGQWLEWWCRWVGGRDWIEEFNEERRNMAKVLGDREIAKERRRRESIFTFYRLEKRIGKLSPLSEPEQEHERDTFIFIPRQRIK